MHPDELRELAGIFATLGHHTTDRDTRPLLDLAVQHVHGCDWASITTVVDGIGSSLASTSDVALHGDTVQHRLGSGPCMQAAQSHAFHTIFPVTGDDRWPEVTTSITAETPIRSVMAVHMLEHDPTSLNLYSASSSGFDDHSLATAAIFAGQAATLLTDQDPAVALSELENSLDARAEIDVAVSVLMNDRGWDRTDALAALHDASRKLHRKLHLVARQVNDDGTIPQG